MFDNNPNYLDTLTMSGLPNTVGKVSLKDICKFSSSSLFWFVSFQDIVGILMLLPRLRVHSEI